ncbi:MAG: hypothetical protein PWP27_1934 [Clostridiales bacterium]|jgi:hypothetical protein|nr:hypothetical protein [Clostridiales bacterium]
MFTYHPFFDRIYMSSKSIQCTANETGGKINDESPKSNYPRCGIGY